MPRFFVEAVNPENICITGEDARHIGRSLRMRVGEALTVCHQGMDYHCTITSITSDTVFLKTEEICPCEAEPTTAVTLYQALPKADKFSTIVQKAVELGAVKIVPVLTERCIARLSKQDFEKKRERFQKIAEAAAKQSGRGIIPEIGSLLTWQEALTDMKQADAALMLYEKGGKRFSEMNLTDCKSAAILVGSEGGFSPEEAEDAVAHGIQSLWLGSRILRCETAPLAALAVLMHCTGNL